jgi:hypothetical protein
MYYKSVEMKATCIPHLALTLGCQGLFITGAAFIHEAEDLVVFSPRFSPDFQWSARLFPEKTSLRKNALSCDR